MGVPRSPRMPTLNDVMCEMISAMSSLNMPTPREAEPSDVEHAYEHLEQALKLMHACMEEPGLVVGPVESVAISKEDNRAVEVNMLSILREMGVPAPAMVPESFELEALRRMKKVLPQFIEAPADRATIATIKEVVRNVLRGMIDEGYVTRDGVFRLRGAES